VSRPQKLKQVLAESFVPERAPCGTVFITKDTQQVWLAVRSEEVLNLSDILDGKNILASKPAKHGRDGRDGVSIKGDPGPAVVGIQGPPGRDAVGIQGPPGINVKGERGDIGPRGFPGPDTATLLADARAEIDAIHAEFKDLKLVVKAIYDANTQAHQYIEYLKAKIETRKK
jgi:hypothetical protein